MPGTETVQANLVVQDLVLILHARHERIFGESIGATAVLLVCPLDLLI